MIKWALLKAIGDYPNSNALDCMCQGQGRHVLFQNKQTSKQMLTETSGHGSKRVATLTTLYFEF